MNSRWQCGKKRTVSRTPDSDPLTRNGLRAALVCVCRGRGGGGGGGPAYDESDVLLNHQKSKWHSMAECTYKCKDV